jgi:hypothetical protein
MGKIIGSLKPKLGKNIYTLLGEAPKEQHWKLLKKGILEVDLGNDGGVNFNQGSIGVTYVIEVSYTDSNNIKHKDSLTVTPVGGKPAIQKLRWLDEYYQELPLQLRLGYQDNARLQIHTINIPAGETLEITVWEGEGLRGLHSEDSRNMGTYTSSRVDKYGRAELHFINMKLFMKILNDKDYINEIEHEYYVQVKYKDQLNTIEDGVQLRVINSMMKSIQPPTAKSKLYVSEPDKQPKPTNKKGVKVKVNIFFDGTLNNASNTKARLDYKDEKAKGIAKENLSKSANAFEYYHEDDSSYDNYYSNVAIMHEINKVYPAKREVKIYIEGEGTTDQKGDDTQGYAFGSGYTSGIPVKVKKAFARIKEEIEVTLKDYIKETEYVNEIELTVFGFSRGAAAARNFISQRFKLQDMFDIESDKLNYKFVGLFDTVSSYSESFSVSPNFDNDVEELKLKLGGNIQKVVHLTANDEYRENFSLTNIKSSIDSGVGFELSIPGVHSDIGGGYGEIENEKRYLDEEMGYDNIMDKLIEQGWYTRKQIKTISETKFGERPHAMRKGIPNSYQYIPLAIMVQLSEKHGLEFDHSLMDGGKKETYTVLNELVIVKQQMMDFASANDGVHSKVIKVSDTFKLIRNKYLHRSTSDALGKAGRYKDGKPYRKHYEG